MSCSTLPPVSLEMLSAQLSSSLAMINEIKLGLKECQSDCNALRLLELSTLSASIPSSLADASSHLSVLSSQASSLLAALPATYSGACASYQARRLTSPAADSDSDSEAENDRKPVLPPWFAQGGVAHPRTGAHGLASPSPSPPPEQFRSLVGAPYARAQAQARRKSSATFSRTLKAVKREPSEPDLTLLEAKTGASAGAGPGPERRRRFAGGVAKSLEQRRRELGRL